MIETHWAVPRLKWPTPTLSLNLITQNKSFPNTIRDNSLTDGKLERSESPQPGTVREFSVLTKNVQQLRCVCSATANQARLGRLSFWS
jgi:hypothetical protein